MFFRGGRSGRGATNRPGASAGPAWCVLLLAALVGSAGAGQATAPAADQSGPMPLVDADDEFAGHLADARRRAARGDREAIRVLQALIESPTGGFVPVGGGRYVALADRAAEIIGQLDEKSAALYRGFYGGRAKALYDEARRSGRTELLRQVARRYRHTRAGRAALDKLAAISFDRARFAQAARYWRLARGLTGADPPEPVLLAKIAVACHLGGDAAAAGEAAAALKEEFPDAKAELGGRRQDLAAFVDRALRRAAPAAAHRRAAGGWPGLGGVADGMAVMEACDVRLSPGWRHPTDTAAPAGEAVKLVAATVKDALDQSGKLGAARLAGGHVVVRRTGGPKRKLVLPPSIHPVVWGDRVLYRTDAGVAACDLLTGEKKWDTSAFLALHRDRPSSRSGRRYDTSRGVSDGGMYLLTVGEGKVFVRHEFSGPPSSSRRRRWSAQPQTKSSPDSSALAAVEIETGKLLWKVGNGRGDDEVVRMGRFVSAPTYKAGRLYAIVLHLERYYTVCLEAASPVRAVWKTPTCQPPVLARRGWGMFALARVVGSSVSDRCSPPAVADGIVFALPNIGVLVAMEADTGRPIWAYHYNSHVNATAGRGGYYSRSGSRNAWPVNPVVVSRGRVICLPADSESLVALSAEDGRPVGLHGTARREQSDLTVVDDDRLLLSGPGLFVLATADGRVIHSDKDADGIAGRPAVTGTKALAAEEGRIVQLDLKTYKSARSEIADPQGLLGNLVSVPDALIAANTAGVCAYFGFEAARSRLDRHIQACRPEQRARLILKRIHIAYHADVLDDVRRDLAALTAMAGRFRDEQVDREARSWAYRIEVAAGNHAATPKQMRERFEKALSLARSVEEKGHAMVRLAKCLEQSGDPAGAAALAQRIGEQFGQADLVDVDIGPEARRVLTYARRTGGKKLGQQLVQRLIETHGRAVYAAVDKSAGAALREAVAAADPQRMRAVRDRWPHSVWADDAVYAAAEAYYRRAKQAKGDEAEPLYGEAIAMLSEVAAMPDSSLRLSANVAIAVVYARVGNGGGAKLVLYRIRRTPPDARFRFADVEGRLADVVAALRAGKAPPQASR